MYYNQQSNNLLLTVCQCKYMIYMNSNCLLFTSISSVQEKFDSKKQNQCGKIKLELRVQIHKLRVQILELEDKKHKLQD